MSTLSYIYGDVTNPQSQDDRPIVIPHVVNDAGRMGAGVAKALYTKWPKVREDYMVAYADGLLNLGNVIDTIAEPGKIYVESMVAQSTPGQYKSQEVLVGSNLLEFMRPPIRYGALANCMMHVQALAQQAQASIHAPRFGSDLAGGHWDTIEALILELWVDRDIDVTIYDYKG